MASHADNHFEDDFKPGTRAAPRLPLSLPGKFMSTQGIHTCIVSNLSRTGVLIAMREPLNIGNDGYLKCGLIDHFVTVTRKGPGLNAVSFEIPVTDLFVAQVRRYQESFEALELYELQERARAWAGA